MKAPRNYKDGRETSPPDVKNEEIAARFSEIADMLDILGEDTFRVLSYQRAARQLESLTENVKDFRPIMLHALPGGPPGCGLLFTSSRAFPRSRKNPGPLINALHGWLTAGPPVTESWLPGPPGEPAAS